MARVALLIGVSEEEPNGNSHLPPRARQNVEAMRQVLQHPEIGCFAEVKTLINPNRRGMEEVIEALLTNREKYDLVLLYFSGRAFKDDHDKLYFATSTTGKNEPDEMIKSTAVAASFVQDMMGKSHSEEQVVILDCFLGGMAKSGLARDDGLVDIKTQLGGERQAVLVSFTPVQHSFEQSKADFSIYTRYLVEGLKTGAADLDSDGLVSVNELHEYARWKVQKAAPAIKPDIYGIKEDCNKLGLAKASTGNPRLKYRKEVERFAMGGELSAENCRILNMLRERLGLLPEDAAAIEAEVLQPHEEYQKKLRRYEQALVHEILEHSISEHTRDGLKGFQQTLGLTDADIASVEAQARQKEPLRSPDQVVESAKTQDTVTLANEAIKSFKPAASRAVISTLTETAISGWSKSAHLIPVPASRDPRLLIGIGTATVLALAGVIYGLPALRPAPPSTLLPEPEPALVPEPLSSSISAPLITPSPDRDSGLETSLPSRLVPESPVPLPPDLSSMPAPSLSLPQPLSTSVSQPLLSEPKASVSKSRSTPALPPVSQPASPKPKAPVSKPKPTPAASRPKTTLSAPESPPTSLSDPPPTSAPGPNF